MNDYSEDARAEGMMRLIFALRSNGVTNARVLDAIERSAIRDRRMPLQVWRSLLRLPHIAQY